MFYDKHEERIMHMLVSTIQNCGKPKTQITEDIFIDGTYRLRCSKRIGDADMLPIDGDAIGVAVVKNSDISVPIYDSPEKHYNLDHEKEGIYPFNIIETLCH